MATLSNRTRIDQGFEVLGPALRAFVEREMKRAYLGNWETIATSNTPAGQRVSWNDPQFLFKVMLDHWKEVFFATLGHAGRSYVGLLIDWRNELAHYHKPFSADDAYRALDAMHAVLEAISAGEPAAELERMRTEVLRLRFEEQARSEQRKASKVALDGTPKPGLKPWRDVVQPHADVRSGTFQQAEFAADLWAVYNDQGSLEYRDPVQFFRRTFLTEGLRSLLTGATQRLSGAGGDPVIELQTNFGGGKTHSMLALYHLVSGEHPSRLPGVDTVLGAAGAVLPARVNRAVLVGNRISPGETRLKPDGTEARTLWGEMAWQLGESAGGRGAEAYALVAADDRSATIGESIERLLRAFAPCVILIDEWVAYARQLHEGRDLPGGSFDTQFTFAQTLTESVKNVPGALLVVSIPASHDDDYGEERELIEVGGTRGHEALVRLRQAIGRIQSPWRPASQEESFEIVRRRLFEEIPADRYPQRDAVIRAFVQFYRDNRTDFPPHCCEEDYRRRLEAAYPIHPELFDRLYTDWGSLDRFQRTRGVLRLMAKVIHALWTRNDHGLLLLPASVPLDSDAVVSELRNYLDDNWAPIIERDIDGEGALATRLDTENRGTFGKVSAARRVARTVFVGTAPYARGRQPGVSDAAVRLGCTQPGETAAVFGDALRRLSQEATHLYVDGNRYWYGPQPSVNHLARDRAASFRKQPHLVEQEIVRRLREATRKADPFQGVHPAPSATGDVDDLAATRLVVLGPGHPHAAKAAASPARAFARDALLKKGEAHRVYRNALVFLAPDEARLRDLEEGVAHYLAWASILDEQDRLDLSKAARAQATSQQASASRVVDDRLKETYVWLLAPHMEDPAPEAEWIEYRLTGTQGLVERAAKKLVDHSLLFTTLSAYHLRAELDRWLWRGQPHVTLRSLADDLARYLYLPRLASERALAAAVQQGVQDLHWEDYFAYADGYDDDAGRYRGLRVNEQGGVVVDRSSVVVHPDAAQQQLKERASQGTTKAGEGGRVDLSGGSAPKESPGPVKPEEQGDAAGPALLRQYTGAVELEATQFALSVEKVLQSVVQHLVTTPGAKVRVRVEIQAEIPQGADEHLIRKVTEDARTLKFTTNQFDEL